MLCKEALRRTVVTCHLTDPVSRCAETMRDEEIGFLPVLSADGLLAGVVTDRDLAVRVLGEERKATTPVGAVMTTDPISCRPDESLREAEERMTVAKKSRIVVVDEAGVPIGVVSLSDVARCESHRRSGKVLAEVSRREVSAYPIAGYE